jgi:hypothetical protein
LQQPDIGCLAVNSPGLRLHLLGLFRYDRYALWLRRWTDHLGAAYNWPAQKAERHQAGEDGIHSPRELAQAEPHKFDTAPVQLRREYRVNFRNSSDATARVAETQDEAIGLRRIMAVDASGGPDGG